MPLETALNIGVSALATEHFFTAFLSSPKASEQFLKPEDVREMFKLACVVSVGFSLVMCMVLKNPYGFFTSLITIGVFYYAYAKALGVESA